MSSVFGWPAGLLGLLLVPVVWYASRRLLRRGGERLARLIGPRTERLAATVGPRGMRAGLLLAGVAALVIAVAQPKWGVDVRKVEHRGIDLLVCLDVSRSMLARDLAPSRLVRAQREIRALAERMRGDRLGLIVFAGEARLRIPLTSDTDTFADLVDTTDTISVSKGGTDIGAALEVALRVLEGQSGSHEAVLLITDGEDLGQHGLEVARRCKENNITVHCLGIGSELGSKIAITEDGKESFLRDRDGNEVITFMDGAGLRRIAETTGGGYTDAIGSETPLLDLYAAHIMPMARKAFTAADRRERKNRFQWPLLAAFLLLMLEFSMTDRRKP